MRVSQEQTAGVMDILYFMDSTKFFNPEKNNQFIEIHTITDFHAVLKRERYLSDRNNHGFSLVTFDKAIIKKDNSIARQFAEIFAKRLRITDTVGWYNPNKISVLLPDTDFNGAKKFADLIRMQIASPDHIFLSDIYTYPSKNWQGGNGHKGIKHLKNVEEEEYSKFPFEYKMPFWKRIMDILCSSFGLLLLSPFLVLIALMIKIVSPGPIFYKQQRAGRSGKIFNFYKFRTMKVNNDASIHQKHLKELINGDSNGDKPMEKLENDKRIIPMGIFLRKSCIDELPQLINVLRGEMSLVGPRPCILYEAEEYLRWHARRFDITPGMTGIWQISGKNKRTFKEMVRMDIEYISKQSFWLDIKILLKTPLVIFSEVFGVSTQNKKSILFRKRIFSKVQVAAELVLTFFINK